MKSSILFTTIFSLATTQLVTPHPSKAADDNFDVPCIPFQETKYENGRTYIVEESCKLSKEIIADWETIPALIILLREIAVSGLREYLAKIKASVPVSRITKIKTSLKIDI